MPAIASFSVLKLVRIIHKIGKKTKRATAQPSAVSSSLARSLWLLGIEIFGDRTHKEKGDEVGQYNGQNTANRSGPDIRFEQCITIDQVGEVGSAIPWTSARGDKNLGKHREQKNRLHHGNGG